MNANTVSLVFLALSAVMVVLGILFGLKRGLRASLIRLVTVAAAAAGAFFLRQNVLDTLNNSLDLKKLIVDALGEKFSAMAEFIVPVINMIVLLLAFVVLFVILRLLTLILYAILHKLGKGLIPFFESRLLGMVIGAVQGLVLVACVVLPLSGIVDIAGQLVGAVNGIMESTMKEGEENPVEAVVFLAEYPETTAGKLFGSVDDLVITPVTKMTNDEGKKITLQGQIDGIRATAEMASALTQLADLDFSDPASFTPDNARELFASLNDLKDGLSEEGLEAVNTLITSVAGSLLEDTGIDIDFSQINFGDIDFEAEGEIVATLLEDEPDLSDVAEMMAKSNLIVDVLESTDIKFEASPEDQETVKAALAGVENLDEAKKASIYAIFGIVEN